VVLKSVQRGETNLRKDSHKKSCLRPSNPCANALHKVPPHFGFWPSEAKDLFLPSFLIGWHCQRYWLARKFIDLIWSELNLRGQTNYQWSELNLRGQTNYQWSELNLRGHRGEVYEIELHPTQETTGTI